MIVMEKIMKYFPFMPGEKETGKLVLAILFYYLAGYVGVLVSGMLAVTVLLVPLAPVISFAASAYMVAGIVFAIFAYKGKKINLG